MASPIPTPTCPDLCCSCPIDRPAIGLDEWAECLCFSLGSQSRMHFWQFQQLQGAVLPARPGGTPPAPTLLIDPFDNCGALVFNSSGFATETVGRDEIWRAIKTASDAVIREFDNLVGYYPVEKSSCYEYNPYWLNHSPAESYKSFMAMKMCICIPGYGGGHIVQLPHKKVKKLGKEMIVRERRTSVTPATRLLDRDNDGVLDTFEMDLPTAGTIFTSPDEIRLFFDPADRLSPDLYRNEIRPITVVPMATGTPGAYYRISAPLRVMVRPVIYAQRGAVGIDPNDPNIYPQFVEIHRHWIDETQGAVIMRKLNASCGCKCICKEQTKGEVNSADGCYACYQAKACFVNAEEGLVELRENAQGDCCQCCELCFDRICINFVSGDCLDITCLVARFAASLLRHKVCCMKHDCLDDAQADYISISIDNFGRASSFNALTPGERMSTQVFGSRRGGIEVIRWLKTFRFEKQYIGVIL